MHAPHGTQQLGPNTHPTTGPRGRKERAKRCGRPRSLGPPWTSVVQPAVDDRLFALEHRSHRGFLPAEGSERSDAVARAAFGPMWTTAFRPEHRATTGPPAKGSERSDALRRTAIGSSST